MSDCGSFISIDNNNDETGTSEWKDHMNLDKFLDYDMDFINEEDRYKYVGADIRQRYDYYDIRNDQVSFLQKDNVKYSNIAVGNRKNEQVNTFMKLKKELYTIAYKNYRYQIGKSITTEKKSVGEEVDATGQTVQEGTPLSSDGNREGKEKGKKTYDLLNNELGAALGNKIEDTYNEIKSSVNWLGNFFSNNEQNEEKKKINIFYNDLYFLSDITILRFLDTYDYNLLKTSNKIIKFILWRQMTFSIFNKSQWKIKRGTSSMEWEKEESMATALANGTGTTAVSIAGDRDNTFINPVHIKDILMKTNIFRCGCDKKSRPMLYIKIQEKLNMQEDELFLLLVYHVDMCMNSIDYSKCYEEKGKANAGNGNTECKGQFDESTLQLVIIVDCQKFELNNMISVDCIKKIINIFNEFYTDVLYRIYIINVPSFFKKVWSLFNMFIDNHTLKKIIFINKKNINLMYDHIDTHVMKHFDKNTDKDKAPSDDSCIFFPSTSLYYKYDEMYYKKLAGYVDTWVGTMIQVNH
ncbi:conserved Plasmodium protein, unknown function [Plasmodium knowlesi strain H]|uniref:CRAL-TRIO domain-containing protein n=3 Tax=Plasmodium knowlesi TaxID=5850 RepID=A0A5K1UHT2_PLAKH|nr:CRAL/TRIO domain-containing protein, putative [Plasmodium knowlesi strain H]OTN67486.1 Uncharacterized protein PKNOH_S06420400 [Plasmodium knowlesi]CAA9987477.1 CRAL/TRIO domain-containing protein, putative [Plasmodium knowlesi strain H]SBO23205.1 conserved Plasmodium protein, unknown function [Plasmodium knowlesi strain H]SBO23956.1 conserved Plasmodium protein, unknown function [Plasmodium knowlesi strain H]VVS76951.1 CRAL/TRIO domain-containing protein, putative [Plasmodium knowlesi stra|eukprot:XP_002258478.1 hypothetical protein, conserved in Plasmodium species [Plasmodium knowlesi strain H]